MKGQKVSKKCSIFVLTFFKIFTLLPPTDLPYLYKKEYRSGWFRLESEIEQESPILVPVSGDYYNGNDDWKIMLDESGNKVSWIPLDPDSMETVTKFPKFLKASPVVAYVKARGFLNRFCCRRFHPKKFSKGNLFWKNESPSYTL